MGAWISSAGPKVSDQKLPSQAYISMRTYKLLLECNTKYTIVTEHIYIAT